jgi:hypothetical protein
MDCVNKFCISCGNEFFISFKCGNTYTNITADRIDNSLYHTIRQYTATMQDMQQQLWK